MDVVTLPAEKPNVKITITWDEMVTLFKFIDTIAVIPTDINALRIELYKIIHG